MGAEATDVRSVKQDLDYKFVKASEAYARAWREAYMPSSTSTMTGGIDDVEGMTVDDDYIKEAEKKAKAKFKLVGKDQSEEFTTTKKGKYPSGLSRKQFKEYQKQLGEKPHNTGFGVFDYERYWFEDHFPNISDPGYEVDKEETESQIIRNQNAENIEDFRNIWKRKTKGTEYENWPSEAVNALYEHMQTNVNIRGDVEKGGSFLRFNFGDEQNFVDEATAQAITSLDPMAGAAALTVARGKNLLKGGRIASEYSIGGNEISNLLGLEPQRLSEEEVNAQIFINNTVARNDYEAFQFSHPGVSFEDWKKSKKQLIKNSQKSETILETKNVPSGNIVIQTMLKNKSLEGLTNLDLSIEKYTKSQMEEMGTTAGEAIESIGKIGEIASISAPMRIREAGDYTKIGGYQFNVTDTDGNIYRVQTQPLEVEEASTIVPMQNIYRSWNNVGVIQSPSAVGEDFVVRSEQMVVGEKGRDGWVGTNGAYMEDINKLIDAGIVKKEDISRGVTLEVSYAPFNTYGKGGDFQNRGIKKYYKVTEDGRRTPLFDPRYYDQTLMNDNYKRQQIEKGNLKEEDFLTEEGLGVVRSLMMNRSDFANFIRQKSNIDFLRRQRVSAAKFRSSINPEQ